MSVRPDVWERAEAISNEMGISKSALFEMMIRLMDKSETATIPQMMDAVIQEILTVKGGKITIG